MDIFEDSKNSVIEYYKNKSDAELLLGNISNFQHFGEDEKPVSRWFNEEISTASSCSGEKQIKSVDEESKYEATLIQSEEKLLGKKRVRTPVSADKNHSNKDINKLYSNASFNFFRSLLQSELKKYSTTVSNVKEVQSKIDSYFKSKYVASSIPTRVSFLSMKLSRVIEDFFLCQKISNSDIQAFKQEMKAIYDQKVWELYVKLSSDERFYKSIGKKQGKSFENFRLLKYHSVNIDENNS